MLENIEKINSVIDYLGPLTVKHVVKLGSKNSETREKLMYHQEYSYSTNAYSNRNELTSIKLNFRSYIVLEKANIDWNRRKSIFITPKIQYQVIRGLKKVLKWLYDEKYKDLYYYNHNKLHLNKDFRTLEERINISTSNDIIIIKPSITEIDGVEYETLTVILSNEDNSVTLTIDEFEGLYHIVSTFDLYISGLTALSYLRRPKLGEYNNYISSEDNTDSVNDNIDRMGGTYKNNKISNL